MTNNYLILERNKRNEFRTNISFYLFGLSFRNIDAKIDTGCSYTTVPIQVTGLSRAEATALKFLDTENIDIKKHISFGVNDSKEKKDTDKLLFEKKKFMELKSITFEHEVSNLELEDVVFGSHNIRVSYDRIGNILIGMDTLERLDIHIGESKVTGKQIFIACLKDKITEEYIGELERHFGLTKCTRV